MKKIIVKAMGLFTIFVMALCGICLHANADGRKRPKVSVIIPVYNVEPWIRECMESIIYQTLDDIEVICVNDGSTDSSLAILKEYALRDNRIIVIDQEHRGVQDARNIALEKVTGEYIAFLNSDDYLQLNAYEVAYNEAIKENADILKFGHRDFDDKNDNRCTMDNNYSSGHQGNSHEYFVHHIGTYVWDKLFKYDIIKRDNLKFVKGIRPGYDTCFSYMALGRAANLKSIPTKLYNYRHRAGSTSYVSCDDTFINNYKMFRIICNDWRDHGLLSGKEDIALELGIRWCSCYNIRFQYASEILDLFGGDIYNQAVVGRCSEFVRREIAKLERAIRVARNRTIEDGEYVIISALDNNKAVDIALSSRQNRANVQLFQRNGTQAQTFRIKYNEDGYYSLMSKFSGKMIDVNFARRTNGTNIQQYQGNNTDAQQWSIVPAGGGYYYIISKCNGLCMDVRLAQTKNGTNIHCWARNGTLAQKFKLERVG